MLGKRIKAIRMENNITQAELAKEINVTRSAVALWETDKTDPDIENIIELAKFFKITTDYLLGLEDEAGRKIYINNEIHHNNIVNINQI